MRANEVRTVLLVKAVEEADREGLVIPSADRVAAAREATRRLAERGEPATPHGPGMGARGERLLADRADTLLKRIATRHPVVNTALAVADGPAWMGWMPVLVGLAAGFALSALDGTRRINVLAFPLLGLVAWNFIMYAAIAWQALRSRGGKPSGRILASMLARGGSGYVARLIARSRAFDSLIAGALERFAKSWFEAARPLLLARATAVLHVAAAAVGIGLIAGLYLRGIALDYQAGWESTFLDSGRAHALLSILYGPASWLTGIGIPEPARLEAIRWQGAQGGERADRWMHLIAATAALYVVVPRLLLAMFAAGVAHQRARHMPAPDSLLPYFRSSFAGVEGSIERGTVLVSPYAYELSSGALERLRAWLPEVVGASLPVDLRAPVAYGGEDEFLQSIADRGGGVADVVALLFSLATTPEDENHGAFISGVRDWLRDQRSETQLRVVIDEAPFVARMPAERVAERRELWRAFVQARGLKPDFVSLAP